MRMWIPYHADIVGYENIHIVDHMSTDDSEQVYAQYRDRGLTVTRTAASFRQKHAILTGIMRDAQEHADILLCLDADEFLCGVGDIRPSCETVPYMLTNSRVIQEILYTLPLDGRKYAMNEFTAAIDCIDYSDPLVDMKRFRYRKSNVDAKGVVRGGKAFYPARTFVSVDQGSHHGKVHGKPNTEYHFTSLATVHFHLCGFTHLKNKVKNAILAYNLPKPEGYCGEGNHWNKWALLIDGKTDDEARVLFEKHFVHKTPGYHFGAFSTRVRALRSQNEI